jgi:hypothetical protein
MTEKAVLKKQHERKAILEALELKKLRGSIVMERVKCGKRCCRKCKNGTFHGPYPYLHYYTAGKVKRRYLLKPLGDLASRPVEELKEMLKEAENEVLGQVKNETLSFKETAKLNKKLRW